MTYFVKACIAYYANHISFKNLVPLELSKKDSILVFFSVESMRAVQIMPKLQNIETS
jgi:hypothetical protein